MNNNNNQNIEFDSSILCLGCPDEFKEEEFSILKNGGKSTCEANNCKLGVNK